MPVYSRGAGDITIVTNPPTVAQGPEFGQPVGEYIDSSLTMEDLQEIALLGELTDRQESFLTDLDLQGEIGLSEGVSLLKVDLDGLLTDKQKVLQATFQVTGLVTDDWTAFNVGKNALGDCNDTSVDYKFLAPTLVAPRTVNSDDVRAFIEFPVNKINSSGSWISSPTVTSVVLEIEHGNLDAGEVMDVLTSSSSSALFTAGSNCSNYDPSVKSFAAAGALFGSITAQRSNISLGVSTQSDIQTCLRDNRSLVSMFLSRPDPLGVEVRNFNLLHFEGVEAKLNFTVSISGSNL